MRSGKGGRLRLRRGRADRGVRAFDASLELSSASSRVRSSSSGGQRWTRAVVRTSGASRRIAASLSRRRAASRSGASGTSTTALTRPAPGRTPQADGRGPAAAERRAAPPGRHGAAPLLLPRGSSGCPPPGSARRRAPARGPRGVARGRGPARGRRSGRVRPRACWSRSRLPPAGTPPRRGRDR